MFFFPEGIFVKLKQYPKLMLLRTFIHFTELLDCGLLYSEQSNAWTFHQQLISSIWLCAGIIMVTFPAPFLGGCWIWCVWPSCVYLVNFCVWGQNCRLFLLIWAQKLIYNDWFWTEKLYKMNYLNCYLLFYRNYSNLK